MNNVNLTPLTFLEYWGMYTFTIGLIFFVFVFPVIFNFFIIPKIEKRVGEKISYINPLYKMQIFARWFMPAFDIGLSVVTDYLIWKITNKKPGGEGKYNLINFRSLQRIKYDIEQASKVEIFISWLSTINMVNFFLITVITLVKKFVL